MVQWTFKCPLLGPNGIQIRIPEGRESIDRGILFVFVSKLRHVLNLVILLVSSAPICIEEKVLSVSSETIRIEDDDASGIGLADIHDTFSIVEGGMYRNSQYILHWAQRYVWKKTILLASGIQVYMILVASLKAACVEILDTICIERNGIYRSRRYSQCRAGRYYVILLVSLGAIRVVTEGTLCIIRRHMNRKSRRFQYQPGRYI